MTLYAFLSIGAPPPPSLSFFLYCIDELSTDLFSFCSATSILAVDNGQKLCLIPILVGFISVVFVEIHLVRLHIILFDLVQDVDIDFLHFAVAQGLQQVLFVLLLQSVTFKLLPVRFFGVRV